MSSRPQRTRKAVVPFGNVVSHNDVNSALMDYDPGYTGNVAAWDQEVERRLDSGQTVANSVRRPPPIGDSLGLHGYSAGFPSPYASPSYVAPGPPSHARPPSYAASRPPSYSRPPSSSAPRPPSYSTPIPPYAPLSPRGVEAANTLEELRSTWSAGRDLKHFVDSANREAYGW